VLLSRLMDRPVRVVPLMLSKVNTVAQIAFLVVVLGAAAAGELPGPLVDYGSIPVALLTALSGAAYLRSWLRHMAEEPHEDRAP
jgi:cardiolipin synthase